MIQDAKEICISYLWLLGVVPILGQAFPWGPKRTISRSPGGDILPCSRPLGNSLSPSAAPAGQGAQEMSWHLIGPGLGIMCLEPKTMIKGFGYMDWLNQLGAPTWSWGGGMGVLPNHVTETRKGVTSLRKNEMTTGHTRAWETLPEKIFFSFQETWTVFPKWSFAEPSLLQRVPVFVHSES